MQICVPAVNAVFVPILKNASRSLVKALTDCHPDHSVVGPQYPGERAVMWRNPVQRIESTYRFMRNQGMEVPFSKWVVDVCREGLRDPHLRPQLEFCDNPDEIFFWDFDAWRKFFRVRSRFLRQVGRTDQFKTHWDARAKDSFRQAYAGDLRIWEQYNTRKPTDWFIDADATEEIHFGGSKIDAVSKES